MAPRCSRFFEDQQALLDDGMALLVLDMGDEADAAGVVLVGGVVETLALGEDHHVSSNPARGRKCHGRSKKPGRMPLPGLG